MILTSLQQYVDFVSISFVLLSLLEGKAAAGEPHLGAQVSRERAAWSDFGEPQTTHR